MAKVTLAQLTVTVRQQCVIPKFAYQNCPTEMADIEQGAVDFGPNYDGSEIEPLVLPTRLPNLLVNEQ